jgi:hypothetical protein
MPRRRWLAAVGRTRHWEANDESFRRDLEQRHWVRQAAQAVLTETPEAHTVKCRSSSRLPRIAGDEDLSAVCSRTDARRSVHGHADVVRVVECRVAAVDPDPDPNLEILGPRPSSELTLHAHRGVEGGLWKFEHREELVRPRFDHLAAHSQRGVSLDRPHVVDQVAVALTQTMDQGGRTFDVRHQHRHEAGRQLYRLSCPELTELTLRLQLTGDEPDRHDPVLLGRVQQSLAGALSSAFVFEHDLAETSERVPDVGLVVDRQPAPAAGVHVGERAVRKIGSLRRVESGHDATLATRSSERVDVLTIECGGEQEIAIALEPFVFLAERRDDGATVSLTVGADTSVMVNDVNVVTTDVEADNGVMHGVDSLACVRDGEERLDGNPEHAGDTLVRGRPDPMELEL